MQFARRQFIDSFSKPYIRKAFRLDKIVLPRYRAITEARLQKGGDKNVTENIRLR